MKVPVRISPVRIGSAAIRGTRIRTQLLLGAAGVAVAPLVLTFAVAWPRQREAMESSTLDGLRVMVEQKADRVRELALGRMSAMEAVASGYASDGSVPRATLDEAARRMNSDRVMVMDLAGRVRADSSDPGTPVPAEAALRTAAAEAGVLMNAVLSRTTLAADGAPQLWIVAPIMRGAGCDAVIAALLPRDAFVSAFRDGEVLGESGDSIAAVLDGTDALLVTPSRLGDAGVRRRIPLTEGGAGLTAALGGETGSGITIDHRGVPVLAAWTFDPAMGWAFAVQIDRAEVLAEARSSEWAMLSIAIGALIPVGIVAWWGSRRLSRPIVAAADAADRVAQGDLTAPPSEDAPGEPGRLLSAIRTMNEQLVSSTRRLRTQADEVVEVQQAVSGQSLRQAEVVQAFGASTAQVAASVTEMSATGQQLAAEMARLASDSADAAIRSEAGRRALDEMTTSMESILRASAAVTGALEAIRQRTDRIGRVSETIVTVAVQTNVLSVNASIEAEKAGEHGTGFAVVASEINGLAMRVADAVEDIDRIVREVHASVEGGVREMRGFSEALDAGLHASARLGTELMAVMERVTALRSASASVSDGVRMQGEGARQIADAMRQLDDGARTTAEAVRAFNAASQRLAAGAQALESEVSRFRLPAD
jgi:methyl-accepting chemotaxis protein WspA